MNINHLHGMRLVALGVTLAVSGAWQAALAATTTVFTEFDVQDGSAASPAVSVNGAPGTSTGSARPAPRATDTRTLSVTLISGDQVGAYVSGGEYHYFQSSNQSFGKGKIVWNLSPCMDWTNAKELVVRSKQDHPAGMKVTVGGQSQSKALPANLSFADYSFTISGNSCVSSVELEIDGSSSQSEALDLDMDRISVVLEEPPPPPPPPPVPAISFLGLGASLIGLPLLAVGLARRRKQ